MSENLTKIEKEIVEKIRQKRERVLLNLKTDAQNLRDSADQLLSKINNKGTSAYYSSNHDCIRYSHSVWKNTQRLSQLKFLESDIIEKQKKKKSRK